MKVNPTGIYQPRRNMRTDPPAGMREDYMMGMSHLRLGVKYYMSPSSVNYVIRARRWAEERIKILKKAMAEEKKSDG